MSHPSRRTLLRTASVTLALPLFESFARGRRLRAATDLRGVAGDSIPRRMVCICNNLGLYQPHFLPEGTGRNYTPSRYLKLIADLRQNFTVFTGLSHPEVDGGHSAEKSFLTTAPHPGGGSFKNSISLDQLAVDHIGRDTRFPSLVLTANGQQSLSWTRAGVPIPGATHPSQVFRKLFLDGTETEIEEQVLKLRMGQSIMDTVQDQAAALQRKLSGADREKFDEYLTSVREVEQQMVRQQEWERRSKPRLTGDAARPPKDINDQADVIGRTRLMYDLTHLALQTDSTRIVTIMSEGFFVVPPIKGVEEGYHTLSHHGQNREKLLQLALIEDAHIRAFGDLLRKLRETREQGETLLDRSMVLYGSNLGNASSHDNRNLPVILAGGGFRHGRHFAFDQQHNAPLANVFVAMLQQLGIEADRFGSSSGVLSELL